MWLRMHKQSERVSISYRKRTKATMEEGINPITTQKIINKNKLRILAAMDSCFGLVMPRQHGMAANILSSFLFFYFLICFGSYRVDSSTIVAFLHFLWL